MADGLKVIVGGNEGEGDPPIRRRTRTSFCAHRHSELDESARRVYCADCKEEVDAFGVLLNLARHRERYVGSIKRARSDARQAGQRLDEVKRMERNARARLRRLKQGLPAIELTPIEIDWLTRVAREHQPPIHAATLDALLARLRALRDDLEPPPAVLDQEEGGIHEPRC